MLFHSGLYDARRDSALPWARDSAALDGAAPDEARFEGKMSRGRSFAISLARIAPQDWNRRRVVLSFVLQNAGRGSRAVWSVATG